MRHLTPLLLLAACNTPDCRGADLEVARVRELGPMPTPPGIDGRDGGVSGELRGRSVWVYGDTVTTQAGTYPSTWRNNTMSYTEDLDASDGLSGFVQPTDTLGAPREFYPRTAEEEAFNATHQDDGDCAEPCGARYAIWGSGPVYDEARDRAVLVYGKVYAEPGAWNFDIIGGGVAFWDEFDAGPQRQVTDAGFDDPLLLFGPGEGEWGIPVLHDDQLYLFACAGFGESHGCRLGRAPLDHVLERAAWEFRVGGGWSDTPGDATALFDGSPNMTVHWSSHLDRWLAVYMDWGVIVARTAPELDGPWSGPSELFAPEEENAMHGLAHAELQDGATEYVSYLADRFYLLAITLERP